MKTTNKGPSENGQLMVNQGGRKPGRRAVLPMIEELQKTNATKLRNTMRNNALLLQYSEEGFLAGIKTAIKLKADLEVKGRCGMTPLMLACEGGHEEVVSFLIKKGADIEAVDDEGMTPLMIASQGGHEGVARILIENHAYVNAGDCRALYYAYRNEKDDQGVVDLLLKHGATEFDIDNRFEYSFKRR